MEIISRKEAIDNGFKNYYTGIPCGKGHICERKVIDYGCKECCKDTAKSRNNANPEKLRLYNRKKYAEDPEHFRNKSEKWRIENEEKYRASLGQPMPTRECPKVCEICGLGESKITKLGKKFKLSNDHNHDTLEFRGWLCFRCNYTLGSCCDSSELLRKMANYLDNNGIKDKK